MGDSPEEFTPAASATPAVSVIVPAYNSERTLLATLESVVAQTYRDLEVIVIDDGSTDRTAEVATATGDPRVRVVSIANGGVANARNTGIAEARGAWIAFLDADDIWRPTKLTRQLEALTARTDARMSVTGAIRIDGESRLLGPMPLSNPANITEALLLHSMIVGCISSGLVERQLLAEVGGFNPRFSQCADWDLWLRLSQATRFAVVEEQLVLYRTHAGNMSSNIALLESDTMAVLDDFFGATPVAAGLPLRRRVYSTHWLICAGSYLHAGQPRAALRCLGRGLLTDPANLSRLIRLPARYLRRARAVAAER